MERGLLPSNTPADIEILPTRSVGLPFQHSHSHSFEPIGPAAALSPLSRDRRSNALPPSASTSLSSAAASSAASVNPTTTGAAAGVVDPSQSLQKVSGSDSEGSSSETSVMLTKQRANTSRSDLKESLSASAAGAGGAAGDSGNDDQPLLNDKKSSSQSASPPDAVGCWDTFLQRCCCCIVRKKQFLERTIHFDHGSATTEPNVLFAPNVVRNQKYYLVTFPFVFLYEQFRFFFNLYFLLVALTQFIPVLQVGFLFTYIAPLVFVLSITMLKEGYDDVKRYYRDKEANSQLYDRYSLRGGVGTVEKIPSSDIRVGDMIILRTNQRVPADMVMLRTHDKTGSTFIRTDQLDGETDWKLRRAVASCQRFGNDESLLRMVATLMVEAPKKAIYEFAGNFRQSPTATSGGAADAFQSLPSPASAIPVNLDDDKAADLEAGGGGGGGSALNSVGSNSDLESLGLENTLWANTVIASGTVIGVVVYTGAETRAVMNQNQPSTKVGLIDAELNTLSKLLFAITMLLAGVITILKGFEGLWYIYLFRFVLLFSSIIPISMRVNLDLGKTLSSILIMRDRNIKGTVVRSSTIPEELGRITYLFSDKTGTLTRNVMRFKVLQMTPPVIFKKESVPMLRKYLMNSFQRESGVKLDEKSNIEFSSPKSKKSIASAAAGNRSPHSDGVSLFPKRAAGQAYSIESDASDISVLAGSGAGTGGAATPSASTADSKRRIDTSRNAPASHDQDSDDDDGMLDDDDSEREAVGGGGAVRRGSGMGDQLNATPSSRRRRTAPTRPAAGEEQALNEIGGVSSERVEVMVRKTLTALALCHNVTPVIEEDGNRLLQAASPDEVALVKFSDSVGLKLEERTINSITLKFVPTGVVERYEILNIFPFTSETKRMGIIMRHATTGEITFYLKGAETVMKTRIQPSDWLEEEVDNLARGGLRTLVIAQRKLTAEEYRDFSRRYNAAKAVIKNRDTQVLSVVKTLEKEMELLGLTGVEDRLQDGVKPTLETLRNAGVKIWMLTGDKAETATCIGISARLIDKHQHIFQFLITTKRDAARQLDVFSTKSNTVLVIDGPSLQLCLEHFEREFIELACQAPAVICCRCSPTQKADIVRLMKQYTGKRAAAIGDGGNDVSMIQAADVGLGIVGKEGKQASLAADFSINQFSHAARLMLWHGRNAYKRSARLSQFVIHRGLIISIIQAVFSALFFFAAIPIYNGWLMVGYATFYTMLPVFSMVLDEDVDEQTVMDFPELYQELQKGRPLSFKTFFIWVLVSVYQGGAIMILAIVLFESSFINIVGITFTALILAELMNVALEINKWHYLIVLSEVFSIVAYFASIFILKTYFDITFIFTLSFAWKVAVITAVSTLPPALVTIVYRRINPPSHSKVGA